MNKNSFITSKIISSITVTAALLISPVSNAGLTAYADRATFENATSIDYIEDFESLGTSTTTLSGPATFATGLTVSSESNALFVAGPGQSTNSSASIGTNTPKTDSLNFDLGGDDSSFGGDFFQNFGGGSQNGSSIEYSFSFYDNNTLVDSIIAMVAPNGGSFAGFISDTIFDYVRVLSTPTSSYEVADNITVGNSVSVPEPASFAILGLGLAGFGFLRKKKAA